MPDPQMLPTLLARACVRRENDSVVGPVHDIEPGGTPYPAYRSQAMVTYAYSVRTGNLYVGYSGSAGGLVDRYGDLDDHDMAWRRHARIEGEIEAHNAGYNGRSPYNCGEAAAYAIAASWNEQLADLVFASFGLGGQLVDPCQNCELWLERAHGYYFRPANWYEPGQGQP